MKILVTGGSGFLGREVVRSLLDAGHTVISISRNPYAIQEKDIDKMSRFTNLLWDSLESANAVSGCEVVVHLAGESVFPGRWSKRKQGRLYASRIETLQRIIRILKQREAPLQAIISASAVGYYGNSGDLLVDENSPAGHGFLAKLVCDWERCVQVEAARSFPTVRAVSLRFGVILGNSGGVVAKLLPLFRCGLGGTLGSGRQYMSWVHVTDAKNSVLQAVMDPGYCGVYNVVAPNSVTNSTFTSAMARATHRSAVFPVPGFVLRMLFGDGASVVLDGQRVVPARLLERDFPFEFPQLDGALRDVVGLFESV